MDKVLAPSLKIVWEITATLSPGQPAKLHHASLSPAGVVAEPPLGMLVSYPFIAAISPPILRSLMAFLAGALVHIGATTCCPRQSKKPSGILAAVVIVLAEA